MPKTSKRDVALDIAIGARVRERRLALGIGQATLGRLLGFVTGSTVHRNEVGARGFTKAQLIVLARTLNVSAHWLLTGHGQCASHAKPPAGTRMYTHVINMWRFHLNDT